MNANVMFSSDMSDESGFTLVELLVALALFSLVTTLLFGAVSFGLGAWQKGSAGVEHFERASVSQELLRRLIGNLYPMRTDGGGIQPYVEFDGTNDAMSFLGDAPNVMGGARYHFKLFVERQKDRADLRLLSQPELAQPQGALATSTVLIEDIALAQFSYLGDAPSDRNNRWNESWTKRPEAPKLVRIRIAFRSDDARSWPDLLIAPRIRADVGCIYDPITMRCRGR
jgi:general secretion pathway protein J